MNDDEANFSLVTVERIQDEKNSCGNSRAHSKVRLELDLSWRKNVAVVAGEVSEFVLPVFLSCNKEVPG